MDKDYSASTYSDHIRANATKKALIRIVPFLVLMYVIAFLDRSNVGSAKQALNSDVGISDAVFAFGAGVFFVGYALLEIPSNLLLARVGARRWMTRIMVTWGLVSTCMMFVAGDASFIILRCLLGIAEAGFFPGIILYLTFWFPEKERSRVLGIFYLGAPLAMIVGNPLSGLLLGMEGVGGLHGWQWMFCVEGLMAVFVGGATYWFLPDGPQEAAWLPTDEKHALKTVLRDEERQKGRTFHHGNGIVKILFLPKLWMFLFIYGAIQIASYGVIFYLPEQVSIIFHEQIGPKVGLLSMLPWVCALISTFYIPKFASRSGSVRIAMMACLVSVGLGLVVSSSSQLVIGMAGLCCATAGIITVQAMFWSMPMSYFTGTQAAAAFAIINAFGNVGGFIAPNIRSLAIRYWESQSAGLYIIASSAIFAFLIVLFFPIRVNLSSNRAV